MSTLTASQAKDWANQFLALAQSIGDYRYHHWGRLSDAENQQLAGLQWTVLSTGEDMNAFSTLLVMHDVTTSLEVIKNVTREIRETMKEMQNIQEAIDLSTAIVILGSAILSRHPGAITKSLGSLLQKWKSFST